MKLSELIQEISWSDIEPVFITTYPDTGHYLDQYGKVFMKLKAMEPRESSISIIVRSVIDEFDNEEYISVYGFDRKEDKKKEDVLTESLALEFTNWAEWMGMTIDEESSRTFSRPEIICHCLHEMTLDGFSQKEIRNKWQEIARVANEIQNMTREEREKNLIPWEEIKKKYGI